MDHGQKSLHRTPYDPFPYGTFLLKNQKNTIPNSSISPKQAV